MKKRDYGDFVLKLLGKDIRRYSGVLKNKMDALKFERDIRNEWDGQISN